MFSGSNQERSACNALLDIEEASDDGNTEFEYTGDTSFSDKFSEQQHSLHLLRHSKRGMFAKNSKRLKRSNHTVRDALALPIAGTSSLISPLDEHFQLEQQYQQFQYQLLQKQQLAQIQQQQQDQNNKRDSYFEQQHSQQNNNYNNNPQSVRAQQSLSSPFDDIWNAPISTRATMGPSHSSKRVRSDEFTYLYHPLSSNINIDASTAFTTPNSHTAGTPQIPLKPLTSHVTPAALSTRTNLVHTLQQQQQFNFPLSPPLFSSKQQYRAVLGQATAAQIEHAQNSSNSQQYHHHHHQPVNGIIENAIGTNHTSRATPRRERIRPQQKNSPRSNISTSRGGKQQLDDSPLTRQLSKLVRTSFDESIASAAGAGTLANTQKSSSSERVKISFATTASVAAVAPSGLGGSSPPAIDSALAGKQHAMNSFLLSEPFHKQQKERNQLIQLQQHSHSKQEMNDLLLIGFENKSSSNRLNGTEFKKLLRSSTHRIRIEEETLTTESEIQIDTQSNVLNDRYFSVEGEETIPSRLQGIKKEVVTATPQAATVGQNNIHQFVFQPKAKQSILHQFISKKTKQRHKTPTPMTSAGAAGAATGTGTVVTNPSFVQLSAINTTTDHQIETQQPEERGLTFVRQRGERNNHTALSVSPKPGGLNLNSLTNFIGNNKSIQNNNEGSFLNVGSVLQRFKRSKQSSLAAGSDVLATTYEATSIPTTNNNTTSTTESVNPGTYQLEEGGTTVTLGNTVDPQVQLISPAVAVAAQAGYLAADRLPRLNGQQIFKTAAFSSIKGGDSHLRPGQTPGWQHTAAAAAATGGARQNSQENQQLQSQSSTSEENSYQIEGKGMMQQLGKQNLGVPSSFVDLKLDSNFDHLLTQKSMAKQRRSAIGTTSNSTRNGNGNTAAAAVREVSPFKKYIDQKLLSIQHQPLASRLLDERNDRIGNKMKSSRSPSPIASAAIAMGIGIACEETTRQSLEFQQSLIGRIPPHSQMNKSVDRSVSQNRQQHQQQSQQLQQQKGKLFAQQVGQNGKSVFECFNDSNFRIQQHSDSPKKYQNNNEVPQILGKAVAVAAATAATSSNLYPFTIKNIYNSNLNHTNTSRDYSPQKLPPIIKENSAIL